MKIILVGYASGAHASMAHARHGEAPEGQANLSPLDGLQFFGRVDIDAESEEMTVTLYDMVGDALFRQTLVPFA